MERELIHFSPPHSECTILKRYKRFLADVKNNPEGNIETVHVPNTGSMKSCLEASWKGALSLSDNLERKYRKTLEMTYNGECWIGVNTHLTNTLAQKMIEQERIKALQDYTVAGREVKILQSKFDFLLEHKKTKRPFYLEVKNVTLKVENKTAAFPDAVSERGQKHLRDLIALKKEGIDSGILYVIQRQDVENFRIANEMDADYAKLFSEAQKAKVLILVAQCIVKPELISFWREVPIISSPSGA